MMKLSYKKVRPKLLMGCGFLIVVFIGILLYREFSSPNVPDTQEIKTIISTPPSQTKPPISLQKTSYEVPATHPKNLRIPKLGVNANIYPMGVTKDGAIDAPKTAWDVGWYEKSALPGENGAILIDGHVNDSFNQAGVFYNLKNLIAGDTLEIERGDSHRLSYRVVSVEQQPLEKTDMTRLLQSILPTKAGLNLVTCGGRYDYVQKTYSDRVLIFAVQE